MGSKSLNSHCCYVDIAEVSEKSPAAVAILHGEYTIHNRICRKTGAGIAVVEHMKSVYPAHHALFADRAVQYIRDIAVIAACRRQSESIFLS